MLVTSIYSSNKNVDLSCGGETTPENIHKANMRRFFEHTNIFYSTIFFRYLKRVQFPFGTKLNRTYEIIECAQFDVLIY